MYLDVRQRNWKFSYRGLRRVAGANVGEIFLRHHCRRRRRAGGKTIFLTIRRRFVNFENLKNSLQFNYSPPSSAARRADGFPSFSERYTLILNFSLNSNFIVGLRGCQQLQRVRVGFILPSRIVRTCNVETSAVLSLLHAVPEVCRAYGACSTLYAVLRLQTADEFLVT